MRQPLRRCAKGRHAPCRALGFERLEERLALSSAAVLPVDAMPEWKPALAAATPSGKMLRAMGGDTSASVVADPIRLNVDSVINQSLLPMPSVAQMGLNLPRRSTGAGAELVPMNFAPPMPGAEDRFTLASEAVRDRGPGASDRMGLSEPGDLGGLGIAEFRREALVALFKSRAAASEFQALDVTGPQPETGGLDARIESAADVRAASMFGIVADALMRNMAAAQDSLAKTPMFGVIGGTPADDSPAMTGSPEGAPIHTDAALVTEWIGSAQAAFGGRAAAPSRSVLEPLSEMVAAGTANSDAVDPSTAVESDVHAIAAARSLPLEMLVATRITSTGCLLSGVCGVSGVVVTQAALLDAVKLDTAALDDAIASVMHEVKGLRSDLLSWVDDLRSPTWGVALVAITATGAGGALARRLRSRRSDDETVVEDSSTWLFARLQNPAGLP
jgi:hypothetical protein